MQTIYPRVRDAIRSSYCISLEIILRINSAGWRMTRWSSPVASPTLLLSSTMLQSLRSPCGMAVVLRVKVLETLAAGKALVATPRALEGLAVTDREQVMVARNDQEFCDTVLYLLAKPEERVRLATHPHEWASTHLAWDRSVTAYEALYDQLLG